MGIDEGWRNVKKVSKRIANQNTKSSINLVARNISRKGERISVGDFIAIHENQELADFIFKHYPSVYRYYVAILDEVGDWQQEALPTSIADEVNKCGITEVTLALVATWIKELTAGKSVGFSWLSLRYAAGFPKIWLSANQKHFRIILSRCIHKGLLTKDVDFFGDGKDRKYGKIF